MQKRVSTVIDGVPVTFELLSVGPATPEAITTFEANIAKEVSNLSISTQNGKLQVVQVGNGNAPPSQEEIAKIQKAINTGAIDPAQLIDRINQIEQAINNSTAEYPWWASRQIVSNVVFIAVSAAAVFGFQIQVSEEMITLAFMVLSLINIWMRKTSKGSKISSKLIPS